MPGKHVYEYAVIRVLPVVERGEFINVGIVLFCKRTDRIHVRTHLNVERLKAFATDLDPQEVAENLRSFERIALGAADAGPIARLDVPSRFRWLTAMRSSALRTSRPHPGLGEDLEAIAERLFRELVL